MRDYLKFYIDGQWVDPVQPRTLDVENPATEAVCGRISLGSAADVDKAVKAARRAFASWSLSSRAERIELMETIAAEYQKRLGDLADAVTEEMGAPASLAQNSQAPLGLAHLKVTINVLKDFAFEEQRGTTLISIAHRAAVAGFHRRVLKLTGGGRWTLGKTPKEGAELPGD